ncbi:M48 family metallopeptidase [Massilia norwichensis]|uniref:M48 family metallopeptidase n=1 Tax=Massilia norwichensis TaxID=1442366 RepID=A0ABT2A2U9_9BURK|nr:SprT family zinc-dependent metalloprotease [Massilia norwichensis]MCS0588516.1 M48 family metallopeptidase [Massilia norwichensis]
MTSPKTEASQLELFTQELFAAFKPAASPTSAPPAPRPPVPLFKAPSRPTPTLPVPPVGPNDAPLRKIQLGSHTVHYVLRRSARRSHGFMISDDGLHVTSPRRAPLDDVERAIRAKQSWILTKLFERSERRSMRAERPPVAWVDGAKLPYLGADITLRLEAAARSHCVFDAQTRELRLGVTPGLEEWQIRERVKLWFQAEAKRLFGERLDLYAPQVGVSYRAFALSSAGTRWGSCTVAGNIRLNWKLVHYPRALLDYVVVHELAHLREMNHSPAFWAVVGEVFPDYDGAKAALKKRSIEMPVLFPE